MANQITIDIGAAANDGTGDPLRTAFNYVNNNFSNVWNTGLPNSNVQFSDNRILTVNTNANLVLAPNGIGKVASNVDIVPNTANAFALGSSSRRWNTVYGQYLDLSHNATIGGNLVVTGNITGGNIHYTGNVFVGDLEGSVFDGASSLVLDVINSSIYVDNYYYANGVPFSGGGSSTYGNANVAAYLPTYTGNISAGNAAITNLTSSNLVNGRTGTFTGDQYSDGAMYIGTPAGTVLGSDVVIQITANAGGYSQTNFQNINNGITASSDYILTADNGNDTTHYLDMGITSSGWDGSETNVLAGLVANNGYLYVQDGNLTIGTRSGSTSRAWNFDTTGNLTVPKDIIPTGNNTQNLGSATRQWNDLYLSNATIYMNLVPISLTAGNVLTVNGADVVTTAANGESSIGNLDILGTTISIAAGAPETYINLSSTVEGWAYVQVPTDAAANTYNTRIHNDAGNIEFGTGDYSTGSTGYIWTLDNTGNLNLPAGGGLTFVGDNPGITSGLNQHFYITGSDDEVDGWGIRSVMNDGAGANLTQTSVEYNGFYINTDVSGSNYSWGFRDSGDFEVPGAIAGPVGGNLTIKIGDQSGSNTFIDLQTRSHVGDALISNIRIANPDVTISTASAAHNWTFDNTGSLTLPNNGVVKGPTVNIVSDNFSQLQWVDSGNINLADPNETNGPTSWAFLEAGGFTIELGIDQSESISGNSWTFDAGGNLNLPRGGVVYETNIPFGGLEGNTIALMPSGGTNADQQLLVYPTAGTDFNHLHLTTGNLWNTEMFLGNDDFYVKLANTGNVVINSNDSIGNTAQWTFDYNSTISTNNDLTLQVSDGIPTSTANINSQGGYNIGSYTGLSTTGGSGTGLTVNASTAGNGYIDTVTINAPGSGYTNGDTITIVGGDGLGCTFTIGVPTPAWSFATDGSLTVPGISTGSGTGEIQKITGSRRSIGITNDPDFAYAATFAGHSDFGSVAFTASTSLVQSVKVTFAVNTNGAAFNWEQFDVAATKLDSANAFVSVSGRVRSNSAIDYTDVSAYVNEDGAIEILLNPPDGQTVAYVNYDAVEFNLFLD